MKEIEHIFNKCNIKSPGPDGIPYSFLQNLGPKSKEYLLQIYNEIWKMGNIPNEWKKGIKIPLTKPGENKHTTEGYRPITLLNTMAKALEKQSIIGSCGSLKKKNMISKEQSGFIKSRSTLDNLITLQSEIENTFAKKLYLGMISLDITKAYDSI